MCHGPQKAYATYKTRPMLQRYVTMLVLVRKTTKTKTTTTPYLKMLYYNRCE